MGETPAIPGQCPGRGPGDGTPQQRKPGGAGIREGARGREQTHGQTMERVFAFLGRGAHTTAHPLTSLSVTAASSAAPSPPAPHRLLPGVHRRPSRGQRVLEGVDVLAASATVAGSGWA